jgi:hypothetical protein
MVKIFVNSNCIESFKQADELGMNLFMNKFNSGFWKSEKGRK